MESKPTAAVSVRDLDFSYDDRNLVLEKASFDILQGDFAAMIGPNGGGKTTLIKLFLGLLEPRRGSIRVFGAHPAAARRRVGYMPQYPKLDPDFPVSVMDVVLMGRLGQGAAVGPFSKRDRDVARSALEEVGGTRLTRRPLSALSSGERQRVLVARALACEPEMLLLDEPTSNLDPSVQDDVQDLFARLNRRMTIVVVSHDVAFVSKYVKRVVCVNRTVALHPTSEIEGEVISMLYGRSGMRLVDHERHTHDH